MSNKILETILKLQTKGQGTDNEHEAAMFLAKAQQMMKEHNITMGDLRVAEITHADIKSQASVSKMKMHEQALMNLIGKVFGCKVLWGKSKSNRVDNWARWTFIGRKETMPIVEYTAAVMLKKLNAARGKFVVEHLNPLWNKKSKTIEADGFCVGWVVAVADKVKSMTNRDPLIDEAVQKYMDDMFEVSGDASPKDKSLGSFGAEMGILAGAKESLFRPMSDEAAKRAGIGQTFKIGAR